MKFFYRCFCVMVLSSIISCGLASYAHEVVSGVDGTTPLHTAAIDKTS